MIQNTILAGGHGPLIGGLAFIDPDQIDAVKMGVLVGSLISAVIGMTVLATAPRAATRPLNEVPSA